MLQRELSGVYYKVCAGFTGLERQTALRAILKGLERVLMLAGSQMPKACVCPSRGFGTGYAC